MNRIELSRRAFCAGVAGTALMTADAWAQARLGAPAEWNQGFDSASRLRLERSSTPLLSQQTIQATDNAIQIYRDIAARGGFVQVAAGAGLKLGARGPQVTTLRQRLIQSGDLDQAGGSATTFDSFVDAAVRRFQRRHGLNPTGVVAGETLAAMNVPAETRLRQLELNAQRLRQQGALSGRYLIANLPAAAIETVDNNVVATRHVAVVGMPDRQSPILSARVTDINFHPFWTVPASIIRKDLIPRMQKNPNYLTENKIRIFNPAGQEVPPESINWNSMDATKYRFRQDFGDFNSMGTTRVNIANPHGVYLHDTNSKGLFGDNARFVSSGCIRVQNIKDFVAWILKDTPGWGRAQVEEAMRAGNRLDVKVAQPIPVHWVYITAWADPGNGSVQFRDDIYGKDGLGIRAVARAPQPVEAQTEED